MVKRSLDGLPIPKRMHWGDSDAEFVRPVHWLVLLHGAELVPARILDTDAGSATRGHRFMAPQSLALAQPADYEVTLRERGKVLADFAARRAMIREQVVAAGKSLGGNALVDDALLDEVTALVEWPSAIAGAFDARFLELPREVLISTLQHHQRYFPVARRRRKTAGALHHGEQHREPRSATRCAPATNAWCARACPTPRSSGARIAGSRWLRVRAALDAVTFQAKLGSVGDKVRRVAKLAGEIAVLHRRRIACAGAARGGARQVRPAHLHGGRIPGTAGNHGSLLRHRRRRAR